MAEPGYDQAALAGWPAVAGPQRDAVAEAEPTGWPEATDPRFDQGSVAGWPSVDSGVGQAPAAGWPSVDSGYDPAAMAGWPAIAEPRHDEVAEPTGWPEPADPQVDHGSVAGWPAVDTGYGQAVAAGSPAATDPGYEWPGSAEPQYGQAPEAEWPATESAFGGQATDDTGYAQPVAVAWPTVDEQTPATQSRTARAPAQQRTARKPARRAPAKKRASAKAASKAAPKPQSPRLLADPEPGQPVRQLRPKRTGKASGRLPMKVVAIAGAAVVVAGAAAVYVFARSGGGPAHTVTTPAALGAYTKQPQLAVQMHAATLREQILTESAGEAHNVVYAVYEDSTGPAAAAGPQIILFIGGNLSGTSAGSFISTFTGKLQGAVTTSAGSLGGAAACVPSVDGRVAECVWADNDTFGVVASQTLGTTGLADEMRQMRPLVEHVASAQ